ncbi:calcium-binding protein [Agitococcus lubricus]|uniref:Ca2+-binding RTX toxin-like protein n=1 Tax=Agitococcus lubricus TaxID=1077255 RepID=A0A2T5IVK9_9GAMM|nr:hypothetical protein [Agitococcus lubricus]PTQ87916.1 Ca2+-binding RTX toxin-like protein [Agitococcus lubricus]
MNTQIQAIFDHALLANAVYKNLTANTTPEVFAASLTGWPPALATYLSTRYKVVETYNMGDNVSGYNGALFVGIVENDNQNKYIFANRGTEPTSPSDLFADLLLAISGANQQLPVMQAYFEQALVKVNGNLLTVTGHSLGGYLSVVLQNPDENGIFIDKTYTFNGAGIFNVALTGSIVNAGLVALGYEPITVSPSLPIENYYTVEGLTVTSATGVYGGVRIPVNTDVIGLGGVGGLEGHSIANLTDALAVYNLMGMVDSDITLAELNGIHEAMSKDGLIENDALVKVFGTLLTKSLTIFQQTTKDKVDLLNVSANNNNAMHEAIYAMVNDLATTAQALKIIPLVSFTNQGELQLFNAQIPNNIAYRYALQVLNPFFVESSDSANTETMYQVFNEHQELDLYDADTEKGTLTLEWLEKRHEMLNTQIKANIQNRGFMTHEGEYNYYYEAIINNERVIVKDMSTTSRSLNDPDSPMVEKTRYTKFADKNNANFTGGDDKDYLFGHQGNDVLYGLEEEDYLEGGEGDDTLDGGEGRDILVGMTGDDSLKGDKGNDTLEGGAGKDTLDGGEDHDKLYSHSGDDTLKGGLGDDLLDGGKENDTLDGDDGNDILLGQLGDDILHGGKGNDYLYGGEGEDELFGEAGNDLIVGGKGILTTAKGGEGNDLIFSDTVWAYEDTLIGESGNDYLAAYGGNDILKGEAGNDYLLGYTGNDSLLGGADNDVVQAGEGDDTLVGGLHHDLLRGGNGNDTYSYTQLEGVDLIEDSDGKIVIQNVTLAVTDYNNEKKLWQSNTGQEIRRLSNEEGNLTTVLIGQHNNQIVISNFQQSQFGLTFSGGEQERVINVSDPAKQGTNQNNIIEISNHVYGLEGNDYLYGTVNNDKLYGGIGGDFLIGLSGDDYIEGNGDDDIIFGGDGDDILYGDSGDDVIFSALKIPVSFYSWGLDRKIPLSSIHTQNPAEGQFADEFDNISYKIERVLDTENESYTIYFNGIDENLDVLLPVIKIYAEISGEKYMLYSTYSPEVYFELTDEYNYFLDLRYEGLINNDDVYGGDGDDFLIGSGGIDKIYGNKDNDYLYGRGGDDYLYGNEGKDEIFGGDGIDLIDGGLENDKLYGGYESDVLYGGMGDDLVLGDFPNLYGTTTPPDSINSSRYGHDILYGEKGNDTLFGGGADDYLYGNEDDDVVVGNEGNDYLFGGKDNDILYGDSHEQSEAAEGNDYLEGGEGKDTLFGNGGDDVLMGGQERDELYDPSQLNGQLFPLKLI